MSSNRLRRGQRGSGCECERDHRSHCNRTCDKGQGSPTPLASRCIQQSPRLERSLRFQRVLEIL